MRRTLEQLKALNDHDLNVAWAIGMFPFEWLDGGCQECMTQHTISHCGVPEHQAFRDEVINIVGPLYYPELDGIQKLRDHLDELYALRLFYDHLYLRHNQFANVIEQMEQEKVNV